MNNEQIEKLCERKEQELLHKYFGNLVKEAAFEKPETIGDYTPELPLKIEAEFLDFLKELWKEVAPEKLKGRELVMDEQRLRMLVTEDDREAIRHAH